MEDKKQVKVILFDGVCNLCNDFVRFVIKRDHKKMFKFASLQSGFGQSFLKKHRLNPVEFSSLVLIDGDNYYTKSTAALNVFKELSFLGFTRFLLYFPVFFRDFLYQIIAKNRYTLFGKKLHCPAITTEMKDRFL